MDNNQKLPSAAKSDTSQQSMGVQLFTASEHVDGQRLDNFLMSRLKGLPRSHLYRLIRKGEIRINKKRCKPDTRICQGDVIRVAPLRLSQPDNVLPGQALQQLLKASVLYEDDHVLVINKPAGLSVHAGSGEALGVIEALRFMAGEGSYRELAHRLDKETSGCLIVAKSGAALKTLQDDFRHKRVHKTYLAIVYGHWPPALSRVTTALRKFRPSDGESIVKADHDGKPSETLFSLIESFADASLIEAKPLTGRTHQIRVHCQQSGHPIIGDDKYTYHRDSPWQSVRHLNLHAAAVEFHHPADGRVFNISAPLRDRMQQFLEQLREAPGKHTN